MRVLQTQASLVRLIYGVLALALAMLLSACGGGSGDSPGGGRGQPAPGLYMSMNFVDSALGTSRDTVAAGSPLKVLVHVENEKGNEVSGALVTFTTRSTYGSFEPSSGTALTDGNGNAQVLLNAGNTLGASTVTATAIKGGLSNSTTKNYAVVLTTNGSVSLSPIVFGVGANVLSAYGTTSATVTVLNNGQPYKNPVNIVFTSSCAAASKAQLTGTVTTVNGVATASYRDNGCQGTDTITATLSGVQTVTANLNISSPTVGSIQYVKAEPINITLKGTGGAGLQESSKVTFKTVDSAGNPISTRVDFTLSTVVGGLSLGAASGVSDPNTGEVVTFVQAGTVATPVRVRGVTANGLTTQSDELFVSTGIPEQAHFSLSQTTFNIEGWQHDGVNTDFTIRVADHFSNPVPDKTAVNFIAEGAKINPNCQTGVTSLTSTLGERGVCSVTFTSQEIRPRFSWNNCPPIVNGKDTHVGSLVEINGVNKEDLRVCPANGRITVLAYAVGEEAFTDLDGDGYADKVSGNSSTGSSELIDASNQSTDLGEAFVDYNENGVRDPATEPFVDFNGDNLFQAQGDGQYNGILCNESIYNSQTGVGSSVGTCSSQKSLHVRRSGVVILSGSNADIQCLASDYPTQGNNNWTRDLSRCAVHYGMGADGFSPAGSSNCAAVKTIALQIRDFNGNIMPAGTSVKATLNNGAIIGGSGVDLEVSNAIVPWLIKNSDGSYQWFYGNSDPTIYYYTMQNDSTASGSGATATCTDTTPQGILQVIVKTPLGTSTTANIPVLNQ